MSSICWICPGEKKLAKKKNTPIWKCTECNHKYIQCSRCGEIENPDDRGGECPKCDFFFCESCFLEITKLTEDNDIVVVHCDV